jgi:hypothetical protein
MGCIRHLAGGTPQIIEHVCGQFLSSRLLRSLRGGKVRSGLDPCPRCHDMILIGFCHFSRAVFSDGVSQNLRRVISRKARDEVFRTT